MHMSRWMICPTPAPPLCPECAFPFPLAIPLRPLDALVLCHLSLHHRLPSPGQAQLVYFPFAASSSSLLILAPLRRDLNLSPHLSPSPLSYPLRLPRPRLLVASSASAGTLNDRVWTYIILLPGHRKRPTRLTILLFVFGHDAQNMPCHVARNVLFHGCTGELLCLFLLGQGGGGGGVRKGGVEGESFEGEGFCCLACCS